MLDGVARIDSRLMITERKSSGDDISPGSTYWEKLKIDSQCSNYFAGARSLGYDAVGILYDVARKPRIDRLLATPQDKQKYTKDGRLYAAQRATDETLDKYRERLIADIANRPSFYFVRAEVVRLESEEVAAAKDAWLTAQFIHVARRLNSWPRNTDACERFRKLCQFWPVCTGSASIEDSTRYTFVGAHRELKQS